MGITVAADPELVVVNSEGKPVPCVGILPGSKEEPFSNEFGEIMEDNVLAEFTINPQDKVSEKVFTKNKTFYGLNKYIIEKDKLMNDNICDIRYALNGKKLRNFKCPNESIKYMIVDLCIFPKQICKIETG